MYNHQKYIYLYYLALKKALNQNITAEIKKRYRIINRVKSKVAEIETAEIEECWLWGLASQVASPKVPIVGVHFSFCQFSELQKSPEVLLLSQHFDIYSPIILKAK